MTEIFIYWWLIRLICKYPNFIITIRRIDCIKDFTFKYEIKNNCPCYKKYIKFVFFAFFVLSTPAISDNAKIYLKKTRKRTIRSFYICMQMTLSDLTFCSRPRLPEKVSLGTLFLRCTEPKGALTRNADGNKRDFVTVPKLCPKSDSRQSPKNVISPGTFLSQISKGFHSFFL